jgi:hypothetical protein
MGEKAAIWNRSVIGDRTSERVPYEISRDPSGSSMAKTCDWGSDDQTIRRNAARDTVDLGRAPWKVSQSRPFGGSDESER